MGRGWAWAGQVRRELWEPVGNLPRGTGGDASLTRRVTSVPPTDAHARHGARVRNEVLLGPAAGLGPLGSQLVLTFLADLTPY